MSAADPIWVVPHVSDATSLPEEARDGRVLALTPMARAALVSSAHRMLDPRGNFGDWAQARTVAAVRRARRKLVAVVEALPDAGAMQREIALEHFLRAANASYRLWFTLGAQGPWMVPDRSGWRRCNTRDDAHVALLRHMLAPLVAGQTTVARVRMPPVPGVYRALRNALLRAVCRDRTAFVSGARKGMFGLIDELAAQPTPTRIVVVQSAGGWRDYLRLARSAWRVLRGDRFFDAALLAPSRGDAVALADRLVAAVEDRVIAAAFAHYRDLLAYRLAQSQPALGDAREIVRAVAPKHYLSADASRISDWALATVCGEAGVTRWVLSRNTHVVPCSRLAEEACRGYFFERQPHGLVDRYLLWSPHGAAAARAFLPRDRWDRIEAIRAVDVTPPPSGTRPGKRRILAVDSFSGFWYLHYWIYQTSDEFLDAHLSLKSVVDRMPGARLTIRIKSKHELGPEAYRHLMSMSDNVRVKARGGAVLQDILDADVVVAYRSTTIEEAIHARRPVLLWGATGRYRYLPARVSPPRPGDRSAIYAARSVPDLELMLRAILDCHAGQPLTDAELAGHVWPSATPAISDLAARMVRKSDALMSERSEEDLEATAAGRGLGRS